MAGLLEREKMKLSIAHRLLNLAQRPCAGTTSPAGVGLFCATIAVVLSVNFVAALVAATILRGVGL